MSSKGMSIQVTDSSLIFDKEVNYITVMNGSSRYFGIKIKEDEIVINTQGSKGNKKYKFDFKESSMEEI